MEFDAISTILLIVFFGLIFDFTNGFHDAANVVSTVIATRVLIPLKAILMAAILNFIGATLISGVAETITKGLVKLESATQITVLCALIGAITWNLITWYYAIPSSSSYALVGGLIGASWMHAGVEIILWKGIVYKVVLPMVCSPIVGFCIAFFFLKRLNKWINKERKHKNDKLFARLQIVSAALVAFAHGLNDAQKSMGIITLGLFAGGHLLYPQIPVWVIFSCALMMALGTLFGGKKIIRTVGFEITPLQPLQGFVAETSVACVILVASFFGMPISSTHMIVGSVTGVGAANGVREVRWEIGKKLGLAWVLTLPGSAFVSAVIYWLILYSSKMV